MIAELKNSTELRRQTIQLDLDLRRSAAQRNRLGQFATPNVLAVEIAECIARLLPPEQGNLHIADPSIGSGSFFSAALAVFGRKRISRAMGIEIDPAFCEAARSLWTDAGLEITQADFTRVIAESPGLPAPNVILANPPYIRHHHIEASEKQRLRALAHKMTGVEVSGLAGLYVYFLLLATAWMEQGGWAAWLIPSEFMDVNYGVALKTYLTQNVTLIRVHRFNPEDGQFEDAMVSSAILIFQKSTPLPGHSVEFTFGGTLHHPLAENLIPLSQLRHSRKWSVYPCHAKNDRRISTEVEGPTLGDFFRVHRGIATGGNKFFILERSEAHSRGLPNRYLRPILPSPRRLKATVIDSSDDGYPLLDPQLCLIDCCLPEPILESRYPSLWEYLQTAESLGIKEGYLVGKRLPWYKQEQREPSPFLCTYMGRGSDEKQPFRFIWNRSEAIGTNLYLMLYPRSGLAQMLLRHPDRVAEVFVLLGKVAAHELRGEGRVYGDGLNKIEPSELGRISAVPFVARWPELRDGLSKRDTLDLFS